MSAAVRRELHNASYDLVLLNGTDLLWLLDELPESLPRAVVAHNIEHRLFDAQLRSAGWFPAQFRKSLASDARRLSQYELDGIRRAANLITLSAEDSAYAEQRRGGLNTLVLPPAFGYAPYPRRPPPQDSEPLQVGFLGNFGWWPNRQGLEWFLKQIYPHLKGRLQLHLFGERGRNLARHDGVTAHGYIPDLGEVFGRCNFMICPILGGAGVSIKAAEAIYNRVPILATPFGIRGLPLADDPAIVVAETPQQWVQFLTSPAARDLATRNVLEVNSQTFLHQTRQNTLQSYISRVISRHTSTP